MPPKEAKVSQENCPHYNCVGIGVGPANLSLACLLERHDKITNIFLDKKPAFGWHDEQQLPDTSIQVSMLKDLVCLADPTNRFSFLSYLHSQGRIYHFINAQFDAVPRQEFRNYMQWATEQNKNVIFGEDVKKVTFRDVFRIETENRTITADNLSIGIGRRPWTPDVAAEPSANGQFHVANFNGMPTSVAEKNVCVVGGGQSGAEAFLNLVSRSIHDRPRHICWITRRANYFPLDDSPFTNEFYTPGYSDYHYDLEPTIQLEFNTSQILTSDGISEDTLRQIYQRIYRERFLHGNDDLASLMPNREVVETSLQPSGQWELTVTNNHTPGRLEKLRADVIIWATGFRMCEMNFLEPIMSRLVTREHEFKVDRDFAIEWDGPANRNIFVHNAAELQRGLADRNLSLVAWRSQRILDRLRGIRSEEPHEPLIRWASPQRAGGSWTGV